MVVDLLLNEEELLRVCGGGDVLLYKKRKMCTSRFVLVLVCFARKRERSEKCNGGDSLTL